MAREVARIARRMARYKLESGSWQFVPYTGAVCHRYLWRMRED